MRYIKTLFLLAFVITLYSCGTIKEGFINQKKNSSDEFLVEKKSPLVMPPEYSDLPIPNQEKNSSDIKSNNKIEKLISESDKIEESNNGDRDNQDFEDSLLKKIKKN